MGSKDAAPAGVWQYKARWRSSLGTVVAILLLFAAGGVALDLARGRSFGVFSLLAPVTFGGIAWLVGRALLTGDWVVRVGPRGMSGSWLKGRTVPWHDVRELAVEDHQGSKVLVVHIAPEATESLRKTRSWLTGRKLERRIPLNALRKDEAEEAIAVALATFAERGGARAAAAAEARAAEQRSEAAFEQQLAQHTGTTWALYLLVGINVAVWVLNLASGMSPMRPQTEDLFRWGGISAWAVSRDGEWWRLLAGTFLHGGVVHLGMNMLGLWGAGKLLNRLYGNGQFLLVYLASAIAGASASLHFGAQTAVSVGASGAVFGVIGALVVAVRRRRDALPKAVVKQIMTSEAVFLFYALLNGFARAGIDNAAHVGGLLAGGAMALVLAGSTDAVSEGMRKLRATAIAMVVLAAVAAMVASTPPPRVDHRSMFAAWRQMQDIMPRLQSAIAAMQKDVGEGNAGRMTEDEFMRKVEAVHLPAVRQAHEQLKQVPRAEGDPRTFLTVAMEAIAAKSSESMEVLLRQHRGQPRAGDEGRVNVLKGEIEAITRRMQEQIAAQKAKKP